MEKRKRGSDSQGRRNNKTEKTFSREKKSGGTESSGVVKTKRQSETEKEERPYGKGKPSDSRGDRQHRGRSANYGDKRKDGEKRVYTRSGPEELQEGPDRRRKNLKERNDKTEKKFHKTPGGYREHKRQELIRLNKYIANAGYCSRREADTLISSGAVTVDGKIVTELGFKVNPGAVVKIDNQTLRQEKYQYLLLNKPKDVITTCDDPQGRLTVLNLIKGACRERLYPVGRLDRNTTGLLLMTNDGEFAKKIAHPSSKIKKLYEVTLDKRLKKEHFDEIAKGVWLDDDTFVDVDDLAFVEGTKSGTVLGIEIHSGKYHVVKRIFEKFGYKVTKLDRTKIDILTKKDLPRGRWRFLSDSEIQLLKRY